MDLNMACTATAGMLAFVDLAGQLLALLATMHCQAFEHQRSDLELLFNELLRLRGVMDHVVKQPVDPRAYHQPIKMLSLRFLAVLSLADLNIVLDELHQIMSWNARDRQESEGSQSPDIWKSALIQSRLGQERMKGLSTTVFRHICTIIR